MKKFRDMKLYRNPANVFMICMTLVLVIILICPLAALFSKAF